jgi:16S rRNA (guanine527-N7)-methyltransferase
VVTARALGPLVVLAEYASPLLREGGVLVAWKGARDPAEESAVARSRARTAMGTVEVLEAHPYPAARSRHLHVLAKVGPTPRELPRRPGMARKRPLA